MALHILLFKPRVVVVPTPILFASELHCERFETNLSEGEDVQVCFAAASPCMAMFPCMPMITLYGVEWHTLPGMPV